MRGRGGSSCRFERRFGKKKRLFVGTATQVKLEEKNLNGERGEKTFIRPGRLTWYQVPGIQHDRMIRSSSQTWFISVLYVLLLCTSVLIVRTCFGAFDVRTYRYINY